MEISFMEKIGSIPQPLSSQSTWPKNMECFGVLSQAVQRPQLHGIL